MKNCNIGRGIAVLLTSTVLLGGCSSTEQAIDVYKRQVLIFIAYIAYDVNKVKQLMLVIGEEKAAVYGAFQLLSLIHISNNHGKCRSTGDSIRKFTINSWICCWNILYN